MEAIKHIFFDLDRTLWDFETNSEVALRILFDELKLDTIFPNFEMFHSTYREKNANLWELYGKGKINKELLRVKRFEDTLGSFGNKEKQLALSLAEGYVKISPHQTALFPGTLDTLQSLKENNFSMSIITNGFREVQEIKLKKSRLNHYFDHLLCSEDIGVNKPDPLIFLEALNKNRITADKAIMVGDDFLADVIGAERVGIKGVLFDPNNHYSKRNNIAKIEKMDDLSPIIYGIG